MNKLKHYLLCAVTIISFQANSQYNYIDLIVPHAQYGTPSGNYIGKEYVMTWDINEGYITYCVYDINTHELIESEHQEFYDEDIDFGTINGVSFSSHYPSSSLLIDESIEDHYYAELPNINWMDRENMLAFRLEDNSFYIKENNEQEIDIKKATKVNPVLVEPLKNAGYVSISPNRSLIALTNDNQLAIIDTKSGTVLWQHKNNQFKKTPWFRLINDHTIVLSGFSQKNKDYEVTWYDFQKKEVIFSTSQTSGALFNYEYQALHYLSFGKIDPISGKLTSTQYINLKTGQFGEANIAGNRQRYLDGYYIRDVLLKNEVSPHKYEEFVENFTIYSDWFDYFRSYYSFYDDYLNKKDFDEEDEEWLEKYEDYYKIRSDQIVQTVFAPITVSPRFFSDYDFELTQDNQYDDFIDKESSPYNHSFAIICAFNNRITMKKDDFWGLYDSGPTSTREIIFWNGDKPEYENEVKLIMSPAGTPIFITPDNYYFSTKDAKDYLKFRKDGELYSFEQYDIIYNRPDIILERLGYADTTLINAYRNAYYKRLEKLGLSKAILQPDFVVPTCKIINNSKVDKQANTNKVSLTIFANDSLHELDHIQVWINNVSLFGTRGIVIENNLHQIEKSIEITLSSGINKIQVAAFNKSGARSNFATQEIKLPKKEKKPNLYIACLGVSEFQDERYNLNYAAKDAADIHNFFLSGAQQYNNINNLLLTNENVTKEALLKVKEFLSKAQIDDQVILFFAGHGILDESYDYYIATHDMDFNNPNLKGIAYSEIELLLDGIRPLKKVLFLDACHGGEFDKSDVVVKEIKKSESETIKFRAGSNAIQKINTDSPFELSKELFVDLRKGTGATVIASAGGFEFAIEGKTWQNGLFTYCLLEGLQSGNADLNQDKSIVLSELQQYVSNRVSFISKGKQRPTSRATNELIDSPIWIY